MKFEFASLFGKHRNPAPAVAAAAAATITPAANTDLIATLQADLAASQAAAEEVITAHAAVEAELLTVRAQLTAKETELATARTEHAQALAAKEAEVTARASNRAIDIVAGQGVPPEQLPAVEGAAGNSTEKLATLRAELGKETDPRKRGLLAQEIAAIRDKKN